MAPARGPHRRARAMIWMSPLTPLAISAAVPAARGAASPVCTRVGIVMNASVTEENTHGASGIAQLNARALPRAGADCSGLHATVDVVTSACCTVTTATIV